MNSTLLISAPLYLSVRQAADKLGLHYGTVRKLVKDGKLSAIRIGKLYRIPKRDVERFLYDRNQKIKSKLALKAARTKRVRRKRSVG